jgi:hypothetical protein
LNLFASWRVQIKGVGGTCCPEKRREWRGSQEVAMPRPRYVHPEFGFFCPTPRFRRVLRVALVGVVFTAIGIAVWGATHDSDSALGVARVDAGASPAIGQEATVVPVVAAEAKPSRTQAPATEAAKASCAQDASADGKCTMGKRKMRMVRVATERPAIANLAIGRSSAPLASAEPAPGVGVPNSQGDLSPSRSAQADASAAAEPQRPAATPKKSKKTAQSRRRDQSDGRWREVQMGDWGARGYGYAYGGSERGYSRGGYGRQGFSFW